MIRTIPRAVFGLPKTISLVKRRYHSQVIDHYEDPLNVGTLDKTDVNVGTGLVGAPACGDVMKMSIRVSETGVITDAKFKTFGCGSAIASSSIATEWIKGKHITEALTITNKDIATFLKLPPVKLHCSMLAQDAIQSAIKDYRKKNYRDGNQGHEQSMDQNKTDTPSDQQ